MYKILVALCSLKLISFGHMMPHCRQFASVTQVDTVQWTHKTAAVSALIDKCKKVGQTSTGTGLTSLYMAVMMSDGPVTE